MLSVILITTTAFTSPVSAAAPAFRFTVTMDEAINIDTTGGTPSIPIDVGGQARTAVYAAGSGSSTLTFTYTATPGDLDLDGITITSPMTKNGGAITDLAGNPIADADLAFTPPVTTGVKINYPSLSMDFINDRYSYNGTAYNSFDAFKTSSSATFINDANGTYFDSSGTLHKTSTANTPRIDYDPGTNTAKGLLIEEARTNYFKSSTLAPTVPNNSPTKTDNIAAAPDGTMLADRIQTTASIFSGFYAHTNEATLSPNVTYTISTFLKLESGGPTIRLGFATPFTGSVDWYTTFNFSTKTFSSTNANITNTTYQDIGNGWIRVSITATTGASATGGGLILYSGGTMMSFLVWGTQIEQGTFATSYISTSGAAVTRAADRFSIPTTGGWYSTTEGTLYGNISSGFTNGTHFAQLTFQNIANQKEMAIGNRLNTMAYVADTGYVAQASFSKTLTSPTSIALGYKENNFGASFDGATTVTDNTGTVPTGFTDFKIGWNQILTQGATSHITRAKYYPLRVSDPQLQLLTQ